MRAYVDIGKYWPVGLSVSAAFEELLEEGTRIDRRTLVAAKKGQLTRSEYITLVRLRDWVRWKTGEDKITIDDLIVIKSD